MTTDLTDAELAYLLRVARHGPLLLGVGRREIARKLARLGYAFVVPSRTLRRRRTGSADIDEEVERRKLWAIHATAQGISRVAIPH